MCAIAQSHEASLLIQCIYVRVHIPCITAHNLCCMRLWAEEKITGSKFDLLSEVIFKDLAVPAVIVKLTLGSCGSLMILGSGGKFQTPPTLPIDTMLPCHVARLKNILCPSLYASIHRL